MDKKPIAAGKSSFDIVDWAAVFRGLGLGEGMVLLDVASGAGNYSLAAARAVGDTGRVYAFDLWREGIEELGRRAAEQKIGNITAGVADVSTRIPLDEGSVDVCLVATALHDLVVDGTAEGALREILRVLKPRGRLGVVEFVKKEGPPGPPERIRLSPDQLDELVQPFGFKNEGTVEAGPHTYLSLYTLSG